MHYRWYCIDCSKYGDTDTQEQAKEKVKVHCSPLTLGGDERQKICKRGQQMIIEIEGDKIVFNKTERWKEEYNRAMKSYELTESDLSTEKRVEQGNDEVAFYLKDGTGDLYSLICGVSLKNRECPICRYPGGIEELYKHYMDLHQNTVGELSNKTFAMLQQLIKYVRSYKPTPIHTRRRGEVAYALNRDLPLKLVSEILNTSMARAGDMTYRGMLALERVPKWARVYMGEESKVEA